jgi:hypothetical protein
MSESLFGGYSGLCSVPLSSFEWRVGTISNHVNNIERDYGRTKSRYINENGPVYDTALVHVAKYCTRSDLYDLTYTLTSIHVECTDLRSSILVMIY